MSRTDDLAARASGFVADILERRVLLAAVMEGTTLHIRGTPGNDTLSIAPNGTMLVVTLNGQTQSFAVAPITRIVVETYGGNDNVTARTSIGIRAWLGDGNDTMSSGAGSDLIYGEVGNDSIFGGGGEDTIYGNQGNDSIRGAFERVTLYGGKGDDLLNLSEGGGYADGWLGNDTLTDYGGGTLVGGDGNDSLRGSMYGDYMYGDAGNDTLQANDGLNHMYGGDGNDSMRGGYYNDLMDGGAGADTLDGRDGSDTLYGGPGDDLLMGGPGADDELYGNDGNDTLYGGPGHNYLTGNRGNNVIYGGPDDDHIRSLGTDVINGGGGLDTIDADSNDTILA